MWPILAFNKGRSRHQKLHWMENLAVLAAWANLSLAMLRKKSLEKVLKQSKIYWGKIPGSCLFKDRHLSAMIIFLRTKIWLSSTSDFQTILRIKRSKKRRTGNKNSFNSSSENFNLIFWKREYSYCFTITFITPFYLFIYSFVYLVYSVSCRLINFCVNYFKPTLTNYFSLGSPDTKF